MSDIHWRFRGGAVRRRSVEQRIEGMGGALDGVKAVLHPPAGAAALELGAIVELVAAPGDDQRSHKQGMTFSVLRTLYKPLTELSAAAFAVEAHDEDVVELGLERRAVRLEVAAAAVRHSEVAFHR